MAGTGVDLYQGHVSRIVAVQNGRTGISVGSGGIFVSGVVVSGNTVRQNAGNGINAFAGGTVIGNSVVGNAGDGISGENILVSQNTIVESGVHGIQMNVNGGFRGNTITSAGTIAVVGGINLGDNTCGSAVCP